MNEQSAKQLLKDLEDAYTQYYENEILGKNPSGNSNQLRKAVIWAASQVFYKTAYLPSQYLEEHFSNKRVEEVIRTIKFYEEKDRT